MANRTNGLSIEFRPLSLNLAARVKVELPDPFPFFTNFYGKPQNLKFDLQVAVSSFDSFRGPYQCENFVHVIARL